MTASEGSSDTKALEDTYLKLKKASKVIRRHYRPAHSGTLRIHGNLLRIIAARQKSIEKVMQKKAEYSSVIPRQMPKKLGDPGNFAIPCKIKNQNFPASLLDLGSSVNLMPYSTSLALRLWNLKKADFSLVMADNTTSTPVGIAENVPVQIGDDFVLQDFTVIEMEDEPADPIILGRPFMCTTSTKIDMAECTVELDMGERRIKFQMAKPIEIPPAPGNSERSAGHHTLVDLLQILDKRAQDSSLQDFHEELLGELADYEIWGRE